MKIKTTALLLLLIIFAAMRMSGAAYSAGAKTSGAHKTKPAAKKPQVCAVHKFKYAFQDFKLPIETRVADLVKQMTLAEKISNLSAVADPIPRLGIKEFYYGNEALHGICGPGKFTVFPTPIAMGAAWDPETVNRVATAISDEAWGAINRDAKKEGYFVARFHSFWAPNINMARDPRWGRTAETYGEDPYLTGRNAVAYVKGMQGNDPKYIKVVSTPKHYAANNEDHDRDYCNAKISERALREYYFPGFRAAVTEGGAQSIMGAYNAINGVPCNANKWLLVDVLRKDWGFNGYVVTDCGAPNLIYSKHKYVKTKPEAAAAVLNAGVAVECGGDDILRTYFRDALAQGLVTEATLNRAITEAMTVRFRLGLFDPPEMNPYTKIPPNAIGSPKHVELARQVSRESIVLLKNEPVNNAPLLPLDAKRIKSVAVVGRNANVLNFGDYSGSPINTPVNPLEGIKNKIGKSVKVNAFDWIPAPEDKDYKIVPGDNLRAFTKTEAIRGLKADYFDNADLAGTPVLTRFDSEVNLTPANVPAAAAAKGPLSVRWTGKIISGKAGVHYFYVDGGGDARIFLDGKLIFESGAPRKPKSIRTGGVFDPYYVGWKEPRKTAMAMLEVGKVYNIVVEYASPKGIAKAGLEWVPPSDEDKTARAAEMKAVRESDVVIAVVGLQITDEHETFDRHDLDISNDQTEYVKQLLALNPNVVVVLVNGGPVSINWIAKNAPAIVEAWYPGEQGGNAIADVLFGDYNPGGRTPVTFYKSVDDLPPFDDYEITKGRTYMYFPKEVLYPFGFGLSYTTFGYGGLALDRKNAGAADTVNVSLKVANIGARDGDEVVQLYVHKTESAEKRPIKQLRGFRRVHLKKGESRTVTIPLAIKDLAFWDDSAKKFAVEPGTYEILVGASSADIRLKDTISVSGN